MSTRSTHPHGITRRKVLKGIALAGLGGTALPSLLAACSPVAAPPPQAAPEDAAPPAAAAIEVNWLGPFVPPYRFEWLQGPLLEMWQDVNPNITIQLEQASSWPDTEEKSLVRWAAGGGPDLVQMGETGAVTEFSSRGMFTALDPFLDADAEVSPDIFYPVVFQAGQFAGTTYAIPHDSITEVFFYNKAHFEEAGLAEPPRTLADVAEYARVLSGLEATDFGLQLNVASWGAFSSYLYANGGSFLDEECSQPLFSDDIGVETLTYLVDMVNAGAATPHGTEASVANGRASMTDSVPWIVGWTQNYAPEVYDVLGAIVMPAGKGGNTVWGWGHYECILENSQVKDAAWEFLAWMLSEDVDLAYHENLNFLPAQPRVFARPPFDDHFAWTVFAEQLEMTRTMPLCVNWREIQTDALMPELEAAWIGEKTPQEALDAAAEKAAEILQV